MEDLKAMASHDAVEVTALCDVDAKRLKVAQEMFPNAKAYADYRKLLNEMGNDIDAVVVSTPDHTHAPASLMAMEMSKAVYCQKPLTHHVSEARAMDQMAKDKGISFTIAGDAHAPQDLSHNYDKLEDYLKEAQSMVNANLNQEISEGVHLSGASDEIMINFIHPLKDKLFIRVRSKGKLSIKLD